MLESETILDKNKFNRNGELSRKTIFKPGNFKHKEVKQVNR